MDQPQARMPRSGIRQVISPAQFADPANEQLPGATSQVHRAQSEATQH
jgi:hypothetical protein